MENQTPKVSCLINQDVLKINFNKNVNWLTSIDSAGAITRITTFKVLIRNNSLDTVRFQTSLCTGGNCLKLNTKTDYNKEDILSFDISIFDNFNDDGAEFNLLITRVGSNENYDDDYIDFYFDHEINTFILTKRFTLTR